jgi:hypothetical protein
MDANNTLVVQDPDGLIVDQSSNNGDHFDAFYDIKPVSDPLISAYLPAAPYGGAFVGLFASANTTDTPDPLKDDLIALIWGTDAANAQNNADLMLRNSVTV